MILKDLAKLFRSGSRSSDLSTTNNGARQCGCIVGLKSTTGSQLTITSNKDFISVLYTVAFQFSDKFCNAYISFLSIFMAFRPSNKNQFVRVIY